MNGYDLTKELTLRLATILEDCKAIEPELLAYLYESDRRPPIDFRMLRILSNSVAAFELVEPPKCAGEFHGVPREMCSPDGPEEKLRIRHVARDPGWDFRPWLAEKLDAVQSNAKWLAEEWLRDPATFTLHPDAPMTPRKFIRDNIVSAFDHVLVYARLVHEHVSMDRIVFDAVKAPAGE